MKLADLEPRITWPGGRYQSVYFLCPKCRKHEIGVEIWGGPHGLHDFGDIDVADQPILVKLWHAEQGAYRDWETLSITPSIDAAGSKKHGCAGWHGHITNGEVR